MKRLAPFSLGLLFVVACTPNEGIVPTKTGSIQLALPAPDVPSEEWITFEPTAPLLLETHDIEFPYAEEAIQELLRACDKAIEPAHIDEVAKAFSATSGIAYVFTPAEPVDGDSGYVVSAFPNDAKYASFEAFKRDFDLCFVAGNFYPMAANDDFILFENSCGSGAGEPTDCDAAREAVRDSINLVVR